MGRKLFLRHTESLSNAILSDEGEVSFSFQHGSRICRLKLLASDLGEYPDGNTWFLFTDDDDADNIITNSFELITPLLFGKPIADAIEEVAQALTTAISQGQSTHPISVNDSDGGHDSEEEDEYEFDDDNFGLSDHEVEPAQNFDVTSRGRTKQSSAGSRVDAKKIRADLLAAREAGFRVGVIGNIATGGIVCVSVRVTKVGISEEAMQAWGLKRSHYFVLMIRFPHGYRDASQIRGENASTNLTDMRVALCNNYKPSRDEAFAAFGQTTTVNTTVSASSRLEPLFIGTPLNELLRDRFAKIIEFRESCAFNWPSAEAFVHEIQGKLNINDIKMDEYYLPDDDNAKMLPAMVKADAMDGHLLKDVSFPLLAMQFALRHFVRCTEFCLTVVPLSVHGPWVRSEHRMGITLSAYVVDLLVSFCYAAAKQSRLREFPVGIGLKVPLLPHYTTPLQQASRYSYDAQPTSSNSKTTVSKPLFSARLDTVKHELLLTNDQHPEAKSLRVGDWIVATSREIEGCESHYRVQEAMFPTYSLGMPVLLTKSQQTTSAYSPYPVRPDTPLNTRPSTPATKLPPGLIEVECYCYDAEFDELEQQHKQHAIITLLDTLPAVVDMQQYLQAQENSQEPTLRTWRTRISESALNLLRWIIASNRSCIMQVDTLKSDDGPEAMQISRPDDRVDGMDGWMQFKFAMGAPDKEQRFIDSISKETAKQQHPTLFAWHGSPISNWHSIIRQGLNYEETFHGRAFGNGVYMANNLATSLGYSHNYDHQLWPNSVLKVSNAVSLQEVVNAPQKFVSQTPHYVVADIDWIQTRYLFIKSSLTLPSTSSASVDEYNQDQARKALNERSQPIKLPITAVSKSRRPAIGHAVTKIGDKKTRQSITISQAMAEQLEDDGNSVISDEGDRAWLSSDNDGTDDDLVEIPEEIFLAPKTKSRGSSKRRKRDQSMERSKTDFIPGTLDVSNIRFLKAPSNAIPSATKALMAWFKDALKIQDSTPAHRLGWHIDPERMDNMYQWIVELHSFDAKLPLAKDMKTAGLTSIVLEMRFTNEFPYAPPFIRVVRPRFLPFSQGGGGHITEGGAFCMELLTNSGWIPVTTFEAVMLQLRMVLSEEERPARLLYRNGPSSKESAYGVGEAVAAYERLCHTHGWKVPDGFKDFNAGDAREAY
ncbi:Ubiquitin-conjugating enzyme E2Q-like protein [Cyphellophora attinorum]|uniref:Ubiquitin-conjugating enzyme E2Q-like protein n=1 Tax=Cyphellophora attinorum TaxID=1664694 RepID=A0A0N0NIG3_9EURO|nr:Ubiquitin-conjugating enzyme E2Q-like protein [Phialophora attinorum]KPI35801.1 Ubiquitin-conjugating enzyme E2Q-like protein [Phialophora attinorum]